MARHPIGEVFAQWLLVATACACGGAGTASPTIRLPLFNSANNFANNPAQLSAAHSVVSISPTIRGGLVLPQCRPNFANNPAQLSAAPSVVPISPTIPRSFLLLTVSSQFASNFRGGLVLPISAQCCCLDTSKLGSLALPLSSVVYRQNVSPVVTVFRCLLSMDLSLREAPGVVH